MGNLLLHLNAIWAQECGCDLPKDGHNLVTWYNAQWGRSVCRWYDCEVRRKREGHIINLRKFFKRIKEYRLRLNPQKCTIGVTKGKLLNFLVSDRGIEVDPSKIKAILEMPPPKSEKEIRGFLGQLQYISQFIAKLTSTYEPIFKLLRKNEPHGWNNECQKDFELIKEYLLQPPILVPLMHGKPLPLYLSIIEDAVGSVLAQEDDDKNERVV